MPLTRGQIEFMATEGYFGRVAAHDLTSIMTPFAKDADMQIVNADILYAGKAAIEAHFIEFLDAYPRIEVEYLAKTIDPQTQSAAVRFEIRLSKHAGETQSMRNCNFFDFNTDGKISRVTIYSSGTLGAGFDAGQA